MSPNISHISGPVGDSDKAQVTRSLVRNLRYLVTRARGGETQAPKVEKGEGLTGSRVVLV